MKLEVTSLRTRTLAVVAGGSLLALIVMYLVGGAVSQTGQGVPEQPSTTQVYTDPSTGVTLRYPSSVYRQLTDERAPEDDSLTLEVSSQTVEELAASSGLVPEDPRDEQERLARGENPQSGYLGTPEPQPIRQVAPGVNGFQYVTLGVFEECDVTIARTVVFFVGEYRQLIRLTADRRTIQQAHPQYFNPPGSGSVCGEVNPSWLDAGVYQFEQDGDDIFLADLSAGKLGGQVATWYQTFDDIVDSIELSQSAD